MDDWAGKGKKGRRLHCRTRSRRRCRGLACHAQAERGCGFDWKREEEQELRAAQRDVLYARGEPVKRLHRPSANAKGRGKGALQAQAPSLRASCSLCPRPSGRGVDTLLEAEWSAVVIGWRGVERECRALGINKAVLRGEVDWEAVDTQVDIAVGAVPREGSSENGLRTINPIAAVVGLMEAEESHAAKTPTLWYVMVGWDGVRVKGTS